MSLETRNLEYDPFTGLVWLKAHATDDDDSVRCGSIHVGRLAVPDEFADELDELIGLIDAAERYGEACRQTAIDTYNSTRF